MRARSAALLPALALLLVACQSPEPPPPPPDQAQIEAFLRAQDLAWWDSMFPGEDPPVVEVIGAETWEEHAALVTDCIAEYDIEGFTDEGDYWSFDSNNVISRDEFSRAHWICVATYPVTVADIGMLSVEQLDWFYDFLVNRHQPCMASLGYELLGIPDKAQFMAESLGYPAWFPWPDRVIPAIGPDEQSKVDLVCPLPEMVDHLR